MGQSTDHLVARGARDETIFEALDWLKTTCIRYKSPVVEMRHSMAVTMGMGWVAHFACCLAHSRSHVHFLSKSRVLIALLLCFVPCAPFCVTQHTKAPCRICVGRRRWRCRLFFVLSVACATPPLTVITVHALGSIRSLCC